MVHYCISLAFIGIVVCVVQRDIHLNFHGITQLKILKKRLSVLIVIKFITKSQVQLCSSKITWGLLSRGPLVTFYLFIYSHTKSAWDIHSQNYKTVYSLFTFQRNLWTKESRWGEKPPYEQGIKAALRILCIFI